MASDDYRCITGFVQFPPREGNVAGKDVRNIRVNQTGFGPHAVPVDATLWPSHAGFEVEQNDLVVLEGKYSTNSKDGKTFHNLSVTRARNLGPADAGKAPEVEENDATEASDDEIPF